MSASKIMPSVQSMLDHEGIYIIGVYEEPDLVAVLVSKNGKYIARCRIRNLHQIGSSMA